jgi:hypothetical protein
VLAARKHAQHAGGIGAVAGFAKNFCIYDDDGVRAQNKFLRPLAKYDLSFLPRHAFGKGSWRFARLRNFGDIGWLRHEGDARIAEKLLATRRRGG